jgi:hypothetical protein
MMMKVLESLSFFPMSPVVEFVRRAQNLGLKDLKSLQFGLILFYDTTTSPVVCNEIA